MQAHKRVLIVEDDPLLRDAFCTFAKEVGGYETIGMENLKDAMSQLEKNLPDAILLDIFLPEENGLLFLEKLKKIYPQIPVVIITGAGYDAQLMQTALKNGAAGYVSKEAGLDNMLVALRNALRQNLAAHSKTTP